MKARLYTRPESPRYQAEIRLESGELLRKSTGTANREEAQIFLDRWAEELSWREKLGVKTHSKTLAWCWDEFIKSVRDEGKRAYYMGAYSKYLKPRWGDVAIDKIKAAEIELWRDGLDCSTSRKCAIEVCLRQVLKWAERAGWIIEGKIPQFKSTKQSVNRRDAYTVEETQQILDFLRSFRGEGIKRTTQDRHFLLYYYVALLVASGARPGKELSGLRWRDVEVGKKGNMSFLIIKIRPQMTKVRRPREAICDGWINDLIMGELRERQVSWGFGGPDDFIFSDRRGVVPNLSNYTFPNVIRLMGLPLGENGEIRPMYSIRHYKISQLLRGGSSIHAIARNSGNSVGMITSYYDHVTTPELVDEILGKG